MSAGKSKEGWCPDHEGLVQALIDLRQQLLFQQALGISGYPLNADVQCFLRFTEVSAGSNRAATGKPGSDSSVSKLAPEKVSAGPAVLGALRQEIEQCSLCSLGAGRRCTVPGHGSAGSSIMVVGDWSTRREGGNPDTLFGQEEDSMLWRMMEAISLRPDEVYVTNILKCCPGEGQVPDRECSESCFSYLVREIGAVAPRIICAMGDLAAMLLVGSREPLFRLRGRFAMYAFKASDTIPVMPTFHPRYLLANPEMKRAAWLDLQAIRRRLDQFGK